MSENKTIKILAIETSCDETAASVITTTNNKQLTTNNLEILSSVVASQIDLHKKYGGVYPEVASRAHAENILPVIREALEESGFRNQDLGSRTSKQDEFILSRAMEGIDAIAVTYGPGLIGSLVVGIAAAKTLAYAFDKPIIPINHWEGHVYSNFVGEFPISNFQFPNKGTENMYSNFVGEIPNPNGQIPMANDQFPKKAKIKENLAYQQAGREKILNPEFPSLILTVSGGHTSLILMKDHGQYEVLGQTLDDAAGEAFDKVARLLGLGYPGGPTVSAMAERIMNNELRIMEEYRLPRPMIHSKDFNFSFSGLKTAVLYKIKALDTLNEDSKIALAYEFEQAITDSLIIKTKQAMEKCRPKSICLAGGVSANKVLREKFLEIGQGLDYAPSIHIPPLGLTTDNAAMIGAAGCYRFLSDKTQKWYDVNVAPNTKLK